MGRGHTSEEVTRRQLAKLRQFFGIAVSLAAVFSLGHASVWRATGDAAFGHVSILIALYLVVVAWAYRGLRRGHVRGPAQLIAYGLLVLVGVGGYLLPLGITAAVVGCIVAVAVALPFLSGSRLAVLAWAASAVTIVLALVGATAPTRQYPQWVQAYGAVGTTLGFSFLVVWLLYAFASGERKLLREALRARDEAMRQRAASQLLAEASRRLIAGFDHRATLSAVASLTVPTLGDFCRIEAFAGSTPHWTACVHCDPQKQVHVERLTLSELQGLIASEPSSIRSGRTVLVRLPERGRPRTDVGTRDAAVALQHLQPHALLIVPLSARGRELGALVLGRSVRADAFSEEDVTLTEELGRRAALALDNDRLYRQMSEAVHARDEFLHIAAHELKTPLTPLKLNLAMLTRRAEAIYQGRVTREWLDEHVLATLRQANRLNRLIEELLQVSSPEPTGRALKLRPVSWSQITTRLIEELKASGELKLCPSSVTLRTEGEVMGRWDPTHLRLITEHLLLNALKFGQGQPVDVRVESDATQGLLTVEDRGMGIPEQDQRRVFQRFERAVSAHHYGGLGLGLFLVKRAVDTLGGEIELESAPGQGSVFRVRLPLRGRPEADAEEVTGPAADVGAPSP